MRAVTIGNSGCLRPNIIREDYARAKARMLLKEAGIQRPPTDLEQICRNLGIRIHYHHTQGLDTSFMFLYQSVYHIVISISGYQARDRWSLAHELGHAALDHCYLYEVDTLEEDVLTGQERYILDREADIFAEELLMPLDWIVKHNTSSLEQLRQVFDVSKEAMEIRIRKFNKAVNWF